MEYVSLVFMLLFSFSTSPVQSATASDQQSLLAFKAAISFDPNNSLANWNSNFPVCNWTGVTCSPDFQRRVVKLLLPHMALEGTISPVVGNLSALKSLNLSYNELQGSIPSELSLLTHLEMLSLRENHLQGNIPPSLGSLSALSVLDLTTSNLRGPIPAELGMLTRLKKLNLDGNQLSGSIPSSIGNLSALELLDLFDNHLQGSIPVELGLLIHLDTLHLRLNNLTGTISSFIRNLSALADLDLGENHLQGPIPAEVGMLPRLRELYLDKNHFSKSIPFSIGNLSALEDFDLSKNNLTGHIPAEVGMLSNLQLLYLWGNELGGSIPNSLGNCSKLQYLSLRNNRLGGGVPKELGKCLLLIKIVLEHNQLVSGSKNSLDFLTDLTNCSRLEYIKMSYNNLAGVLPPSIGHLSSKLSILQLAYNRIRGSIPPEITHLTNLITLNLSGNILSGYIPSGIKRFHKLETLYLSGNRLKGSLPEEIGHMQSLGLLDVSWNKLSGSIPASLANPQQLRRVFLHHNHFSGEIPSSLQRCKNLELLDLSHNELVGSIPGEVMASLESLQFYLNLSRNFLQGPLPGEISKIVNAQAIDISCNELDGMIPAAIANCIALEHLNLSHNAIEGLIPDTLGKLQNLESIDLSFNFLSGAIPISLRKIKVLRYLNVCFNNLTGRIPEGGLFPNSTVTALLMGNEGLCGLKKYSVSACPKRGLSPLAKVMLSAAGFIAFILCSLLLRTLWYQNKQFDLLNFMLGRLWRPKFTYQDLFIATNGFNETNLLGLGRFGSVYKGVLTDGKVIAIKVFNLQNEEVQKSFKKECRILGRTRHRNLVRVISVCSYPDFKALILEFAVNGSLEKHLYHPNSDDEEACGFNLGECLNIAIDVAHAMEYLHHDSPVQVVHCDLKPSNVLLDADMTALVTDFGISKLTGLTNSMESLSIAFALRGSIGYIAPEYGLGGNICIKGDVYSYGVLLLEMVTKKRPTDAMFVEDLTLQKWVGSAFPHRVADIVDNSLLANVNTEENSSFLVSFIRVALLCTNESPQQRPTMREVGKALEVFRATFMVGATATTASNLAITISDLVRETNAKAESDSQSSTY